MAVRISATPENVTGMPPLRDQARLDAWDSLAHRLHLPALGALGVPLNDLERPAFTDPRQAGLAHASQPFNYSAPLPDLDTPGQHVEQRSAYPLAPRAVSGHPSSSAAYPTAQATRGDTLPDGQRLRLPSPPKDPWNDPPYWGRQSILTDDYPLRLTWEAEEGAEVLARMIFNAAQAKRAESEHRAEGDPAPEPQVNAIADKTTAATPDGGHTAEQSLSVPTDDATAQQLHLWRVPER